MADAKLSSFPVATSINNTDYVPVLQNSANKLVTAGQLKTFVSLPAAASAVTGAIPIVGNVVGITGTCTLANATGSYRIALIAEGTGTLAFTTGSYTFTIGNTIELIWFASKWNVLSVQGMVAV